MSINYKNLRGKVEYCLKNSEQCRNSDLYLYETLLHTFPIYSKYVHQDSNGKDFVYLEDKSFLPKEEDVCRIRRKINSEGKYRATSPEVQDKRNKLEKKWRFEMSPSNPSIY